MPSSIFCLSFIKRENATFQASHFFSNTIRVNFSFYTSQNQRCRHSRVLSQNSPTPPLRSGSSIHTIPLWVFVSLTNAAYTTIIRLYCGDTFAFRLCFLSLPLLLKPHFADIVRNTRCTDTYHTYIHFSYKIRVYKTCQMNITQVTNVQLNLNRNW